MDDEAKLPETPDEFLDALGERLVAKEGVDKDLAGLCCTKGVRDSLRESSVVADGHEQLVPYEVQDQELAFVQYGAEATRFAIDLV